jgi:hypothetical protein
MTGFASYESPTFLLFEASHPVHVGIVVILVCTGTGRRASGRRSLGLFSCEFHLSSFETRFLGTLGPAFVTPSVFNELPALIVGARGYASLS